MCFKCSGSRFEFLDVRLYTEEEKKTLDKAKERAKEKKKEDAIASSDAKKAKWLGANGFTPEGTTYCIIGDTYSIKDTLKNAGFKYSPLLNWHGSEYIDLPDGYKFAEVSFNNLYQWNQLTHIAVQLPEADAFMKKIFTVDKPLSTSEYFGTPGERYKEIPAILTSKSQFSGYYGLTNIYNFISNGNILTWMTTTVLTLPVNTAVKLTFTVKKHEIYKEEKITQISRCVAEVA